MMRFNNALRQTIQYQVAYRSAAAQGAVTNQAFRKSMASTVSTMQSYNINAVQGTGATNQFKASLKGAASWLRQMSIGLYVVGGAATSIARPLIALSMIMNTYQNMEWESATIERWIDTVGDHFKWLGNYLAGVFSSITTHIRNGIAAMLRYAKTLPVVGTAIRSLMATIRSINWPVMFSWIGIIAAALIGLGMAAKRLSKKFQPVSEHLQRAISVSAIAQDQFEDLTEAVFELQKRLGVFTTEEIANMVERMAYAGAVGESFKETAMAIGQIAYVTGMEMAEITRDMARLTSQTGAKYKELANVILRTFAQASITYEETVESFQQAGMLLREDLGMTTSDLGAIVVQLEKFGYTGTRAATAIRSLAARSSELREGLRGSKEIFEDLGVTEAVEQFKAGEMALDELIMTFGEAGASYGHMVNIFNRRAGVAAAAIAEFSNEYQAAGAQIEQSTTEITGMFDDLKSTYQGVQDQAKAARSRAMQRWAFALRHIGKAVTRATEGFWNFVAWLGGVAGKLPSAFSIILNSIRLFADGIDAVLVGITNGLISMAEKIVWVGKIAAKVLPGISAKPIQDVLDTMKGFREAQTNWLQQRIANHVKTLKGAAADLWGDDGGLEVSAQVEYRVEQFERATEEFDEKLGKTVEGLVEFRDALHPDFIKKLGKEVIAFAESLKAVNYRVDNLIDSLEDSFKSAKIMSENLDWESAWTRVTDEMGSVITDFARLGTVSRYLENKFEDVREELEEMFGLSRTVQRRHGGTIQATGQRIGDVQGQVGAMNENARAIREYLGEESFNTVREAVKSMSDFTGNFTSTILKLMDTKEGKIESFDDLFREFIKQILPSQEEIDLSLSVSEKKAKFMMPTILPGADDEVWKSLTKQTKQAILDLSDRLELNLDRVDASPLESNLTSTIKDLGFEIDISNGVNSLNSKMVKRLKDVDPDWDLSEGWTAFEGSFKDLMSAVNPNINLEERETWKGLEKQVKNTLSTMSPDIDFSDGINLYEQRVLDEMEKEHPELDFGSSFDKLQSLLSSQISNPGESVNLIPYIQLLSGKLGGQIALSETTIGKNINIVDYLSTLDTRTGSALVPSEQTVNSNLNLIDSLSELGSLVSGGLKINKETIKNTLSLTDGLEGFKGNINDVLDQAGLEKEDLTPGAQAYLTKFVEANREAGEKVSKGIQKGAGGFFESFKENIPTAPAPGRSEGGAADQMNWWQKLADWAVRFMSIQAFAEGGDQNTKGVYGPSYRKIFSTMQNTLDNIDEDVGTIATTTKDVQSTKVIHEGHNVEVTIKQDFDNNFEWSVEGGDSNTATRSMIKRAVDRAASELEQSLRASVDPETLERLVVEKLEEEIKGKDGVEDAVKGCPFPPEE